MSDKIPEFGAPPGGKAPRESLREKAAALPRKPGVYLWLDRSGAVVYVGKAKNLRARVLSYFRLDGDGRPQVPHLMTRAVNLEYIVTGSEIEALVTEANIVRSKQPRYNVRLKDDKRYPYIIITREPFPRIYVTRTVRDDGSRYLGPYTDVRALRKTITLVHSIFPLRTCMTTISPNTRTRACLNYQIGKCSGPCMGYVSPDDYAAYVEDAYRFLTGKNEELMRDLLRRMKAAADVLEFERAAGLRELATAIQKVNERRQAFSQRRLTGDWDVVNDAVVDTEACVVIMEIRGGNIFEKKNYFLRGVQYSTPREMLTSFILQYYLRTSTIPPEIHLSRHPEDESALEKLLSERRGRKCVFCYPQRGEKHRLLSMTALNAGTILNETLEKRERKREQPPRAVLSLERDLHLGKPPRTIACVDISHLTGTDTVGSLVFFRDGKPEKSGYRRFKLEMVVGIDDFASMREVITRYFGRLKAEGRELPDLLLVDGGRGQLSSAREALVAVGFPGQQVAGLAKRLEEVFLPGVSASQNIPKTSSSIHLLQRIRDEAHRFAVTYQRNLRRKRTISTALTALPGIGKERAAALLRRFGSIEAVRRAAVDDIAQVPGIGPRRAASIFAHLHGEEKK